MGAMKARVVAAREAADEARRVDDELLDDVAWDELSGSTDNPMEKR